MDADAPHLLSVAQVAALLDVTPARVRQMVNEGKLPEATRAGERAAVWPAGLIHALLEYRAGKISVPGAILTPASSPLTRIHDTILEYQRHSWRGPSVARAHVRVWTGQADEGRRTVVLVGQLTDEWPIHDRLSEDLAVAIDDQLLAGGAMEAAWYAYTPTGDYATQHEVESRLLHRPETPARSSLRDRFSLRRPPAEEEPFERFSRWGVGPGGDIEHLGSITGEEVECFPPAAYTAATVEMWQRSRGEQVAVEHDTLEFRILMRAIGALEAAGTEPAAAGLNPDLIDPACRVLAAVAQERLDYQESMSDHWNDGTHNLEGTGSKRPVPTVFAARLVPVTPTSIERERLTRYTENPFAWPTHSRAVEQMRPLLESLRIGAESVDEHSDNHHPERHAALKRAAGYLADSMHQASPAFAAEDLYPDDTPRNFEQVGRHDATYLGQVRWATTAGNARRRRRLAAQFLEEERHLLEYGTDPEGHLVAFLPAQPGRRRRLNYFAVEWPHRPQPYPDGSHVVADAESGDRPVYIETPAGQLIPLPSDPRPLGGWNFGYGGGGPGTLSHAICRVANTDPGPVSLQIEDAVRAASGDELRLELPDYRPPATAAGSRDPEPT